MNPYTSEDSLEVMQYRSISFYNSFKTFHLYILPSLTLMIKICWREWFNFISIFKSDHRRLSCHWCYPVWKAQKYSETDIFKVIDVLIDVKHLLCLVAIFFQRTVYIPIGIVEHHLLNILFIFSKRWIWYFKIGTLLEM